MKTGADFFAEELYNFGVRVAFVFTGGAISAIIDSFDRIGIKIIPYDHELDASYAAEGYVRATSRPAVVLVTSGPGVTNAITGIAGSWFDSIPVLFISGQVKSFEKTNFELNLQNGFQETDVIKSTNHFAKYCKAVDHCSQLIPSAREAFKSMLTGRPGPAVLDITMDAQTEVMENSNSENFDYYNFSETLAKGILPNNLSSPKKDYEYLFKRMLDSQNPIILIGGGTQWLPSGFFDRVVKKLKIKIISTYAGINAISQDNIFYKGMIGPFGHPKANKDLIEASDLFILGARIPQRALPLLTEQSKKKLQLIRKFVLTLDPSEFINHRIGPIEKIFQGLLYDFFKYIDEKIEHTDLKVMKKDLSSNLLPNNMFMSIPSQSDNSLPTKNNYSVNQLIDSLNNTLPQNSNIFVDVGQNAVALALGLKRSRGEKLFSSWANSPMGYSLPASLGAALENKNRQTICVIGDGGLRTALSSFPNLRLMKGKVKIILWDNQGYRTIVDHLEKMLSGRRKAVTLDSGIPYFPMEKVLTSCDLELLYSKNDLDQDMKYFFCNDKIDVMIVSIDPSIRMIPNNVI
jgi:acetolactate synthase I/II/III large subunit